MTDDLPETRDPPRRIAHDFATEAVPVDTVPTFNDWSAVVGDVADDVERVLRREVEA